MEVHRGVGIRTLVRPSRQETTTAGRSARWPRRGNRSVPLVRTRCLCLPCTRRSVASLLRSRDGSFRSVAPTRRSDRSAATVPPDSGPEVAAGAEVSGSTVAGGAGTVGAGCSAAVGLGTAMSDEAATSPETGWSDLFASEGANVAMAATPPTATTRAAAAVNARPFGCFEPDNGCVNGGGSATVTFRAWRSSISRRSDSTAVNFIEAPLYSSVQAHATTTT